MKKELIAMLLTFITLTSYTQEFDLDTLLFNGSSENRINYVILGDGYLDSQSHVFKEDVQQFISGLFKVTPFKEYINFFNLFAIFVPSNEEGAANDPENLIDNYFGSTFNYAGLERLLVPTNNGRVTDVLMTNFPTYDQVFMLVNSSKYGGSGGWIATSSTNEQSSEIAIHEIGHSFAGLADEYWAGEQYAWETYNMTQEISSDIIRWKNWLGDENIGILSHSGNSSWKKPHSNCKMQFLGSPFCAVCREQFIRTIHELAFNIDEYSPATLDNIGDNIDFDISLITPVPNTLKISWVLNDQDIASNETSIQINRTDLNEGNNILKVNVYDSTAYDRRTTYYLNSVTWSINNEVTSTFSKTEEEKEEEVITSIETVTEEKFMISVFPNPTSNRLIIKYVLDQPSDLKLSLYNESGQVVTRVSEHGNTGGQEYEIDMSIHDQGIYFLKFQSNAFNQTIKVIKQN